LTSKIVPGALPQNDHKYRAFGASPIREIRVIRGRLPLFVSIRVHSWLAFVFFVSFCSEFLTEDSEGNED
jgi:hypothetical protein